MQCINYRLEILLHIHKQSLLQWMSLRSWCITETQETLETPKENDWETEAPRHLTALNISFVTSWSLCLTTPLASIMQLTLQALIPVPSFLLEKPKLKQFSRITMSWIFCGVAMVTFIQLKSNWKHIHNHRLLPVTGNIAVCRNEGHDKEKNKTNKNCISNQKWK